MTVSADAHNPIRRPLRMGWFTTANGTGSRGMFTAVLDAIRSSHLNAEFEFVFVSRERGQTAPTDSFLDLTEANNIETVTLSSHRFRRDNNGADWSKLREAYDNAVLLALDGFTPDISVMAGYMLYAPEISRRMLVLNQHPALPGGTIGKWQDAVWDVIENNRDRHGAMMHIATPELDRGPVAAYCSFSVRGPQFQPLWADAQRYDIGELRSKGDENLPLFKAIREAGVMRERPLVVETLKAVASGEIDLNAIAAGTHSCPVDMTEAVEEAVAQYQS